MLNDDERKLLTKGMLIIKIVWGAMLFSLAIYLLVGQLLKESFQPGWSADFSHSLFRNILFLISAVTLFVAAFIRRTMLKVKRGHSSAEKFQPPMASQHLAVTRYMSAIIISLALSESIGIYGLVMFFLSKDFQSLYTFILISALAMIYFRPKIEELTNLAKAMKQV